MLQIQLITQVITDCGQAQISWPSSLAHRAKPLANPHSKFFTPCMEKNVYLCFKC